MCGRFTHLYKWKDLVRVMRLLSPAAPWPEGEAARYNVAPTQLVPVVRDGDEGRKAVMMKWGLVPFWADDPGIGNRLINARSEEAAVKPSFREAAKARRCLIPVSGFYEWQPIAGEKVKQPWYIRVKDVPLFAFAGLWERWSREGTTLETFTILTGKPNALVAPIHDRMPCIVKPDRYDMWLNTKSDWDDVDTALDVFPAEEMEAWRVGTRVNSPQNEGEDLLTSVEERTPRLF